MYTYYVNITSLHQQIIYITLDGVIFIAKIAKVTCLSDIVIFTLIFWRYRNVHGIVDDFSKIPITHLIDYAIKLCMHCLEICRSDTVMNLFLT